jgi:hypothetical protein
MNEIIRPDSPPLAITTEDPSLAILLAKADLDQQIATARAFPRSLQRVLDNVMALATLDVDTAKSCIYALPRGRKPVEGASVRLAEIIASQWGNCRSGARVVHVDRLEKVVIAEGVFHDLETNAATKQEIRRRLVDKEGKLYNDDMIVVTGNAAAAIARRNAILAGVPKGIWGPAYQRCRSVIAGTVETLEITREKVIASFAHFGVKPAEIFAVMEIKGPEDILLDDIVTLEGMFSALKNGEETVETMFRRGRGAAVEKAPPRVDPLADKVQPATSRDLPQEAAPKEKATDAAPKGEKPAQAAQATKGGPPDAEAVINDLANRLSRVETAAEIDDIEEEIAAAVETFSPADKGRARRMIAQARETLPI